MKNSITGTILALLSSALLASCSQTVGIALPPTGTASDYIWSSSQLAHGVNYYLLRNGAGTSHLLSSTDGTHIHDALLSNEITMYLRTSTDSVVIDSMGTNSIFSLPSGYFFGRALPPDTTIDSTVIRDTTLIITTVIDSVKDTTRDTAEEVNVRDTAILHLTPADTMWGGLLALYGPDLDSGKSWTAGTITGPAFPNGIPVLATVLDRVDSLHVQPASSGADSAFGESFQIRYAPEISVDSTNSPPMYWLAYYSKYVGPVLIEQYIRGGGGTYISAERAQYIRQEP